MLRHADVWRALDDLAADHGLTPSGLARKAGLDPTTFNKSKRVTPAGRPRWPSTESLSKALAATGASLADFVSLVGGNGRGKDRKEVSQPIPVMTLSKAERTEPCFEKGRPRKDAGWDELSFPDIGDPDAYAFEIDGNDLAPALKSGALVVISPHASVRQGDRVAVRLASGRIVIGEMARRTADRIELVSICERGEGATHPVDDVVALHRVLWASQ